MKNFKKQIAVAAFLLLLFSLPALKASAQEIPKADNTIHDRMTAIMRKSDNVVLPEAVTAKLESINANHPRKKKLIYLQTSVLRVFHNKALPKNDIDFFGEQILKSTSPSIAAITPDIKQLLALTK